MAQRKAKTKAAAARGSSKAPERSDLTQIGASLQAHEFFKDLVALGVVSEMMDGYRLAVAVAIAENKEPRRTEVKGRKTMYSTGNLDPDGEMKTVVQECFPKWSQTPYRAIEDLADQGVKILRDICMEGSDFFYAPLLEKYLVVS
jgi:hypothetical protein